jgi:hypothetical protein
METVTKQDHHASQDRSKSKSKAPRSTRAAANPEAKKKGYKAGPGRPKGSTIQESGLTPNQEKIAQDILEAELKNGLWPASVKELVEATGKSSKTIRDLLRRDDFQAYLFKLLELEGLMLEGAFWRGLALGLQTGDVKVLELYARMTGKIKPVQKETKVEVQIKGVEGVQLPEYTGDVIDAEVVEE